MIVRSWSARLEARRVAAYLAHLERSVKPGLASLPGFLGITVMSRGVSDTGDGMREVVVQTRWTSLDAVRAFAGDDISAAVVEPAAAALLTDYDRRVLHYEVIG
jgi:heme-degrading monooxygenase HmoA